MDAIIGGLIMCIGFAILVPDFYWIWKCFRPERHWFKKLRNNDYKAIMWSCIALVAGMWLFKAALMVGLGRGIAYSLVSIFITLFFWCLYRFRSVREFIQDKPWQTFEHQ